MTVRPAPAHSSISRRLDRALQRVWRFWLRSQFLLFQRHRHNTVVLETVAGLPIVVLPGVLNPVLFRTGEFLAEELASSSGPPLIPIGATVLDMGTGSGVAAMVAAKQAERVVAVDINQAAVRCARINALLNDLEACVEVLHGDLFEPLAGRRFDVILFNPPFLRGEPRNDFERALWSDGLMERFVLGLSDHLQPGGHLVLLLSSIGEEQPWLAALHGADFRAEVAAQRNLISEVLTIYRVWPVE